MKTVEIDYILHLASFLDEKDIKWVSNGEKIIIPYQDESELFRIAFNFGKFYQSIDQ